jgi:cytochrome oxidase assembly protein ShyY1
LPDNHLQYAITWFALAAGLIGVYIVFVRRRFKEPP